MGLLLHRLAAAFLALALITPAGVVCGSPAAADDDPMAGMSCCTRLAPASDGSVGQDCCRMNEGRPDGAPDATLPPRGSVTADIAPARATTATPIFLEPGRASHDYDCARGRPLAPAFLRTSALLI
jgi:hypothetical protein